MKTLKIKRNKKTEKALKQYQKFFDYVIADCGVPSKFFK